LQIQLLHTLVFECQDLGFMLLSGGKNHFETSMSGRMV